MRFLPINCDLNYTEIFYQPLKGVKMNENKTFLIVNAVPNTDDMPSFQSYLSQIVEIFKQFGGTNFQRFKTVEQIMGQGGIKAAAIVEFPDSEAIHKMVASEEFNALNELRKRLINKKLT